MKPENIMFGYGQKLPRPTLKNKKNISENPNIFKDIKINLIDYGMSK